MLSISNLKIYLHLVLKVLEIPSNFPKINARQVPLGIANYDLRLLVD